MSNFAKILREIFSCIYIYIYIYTLSHSILLFYFVTLIKITVRQYKLEYMR